LILGSTYDASDAMPIKMFGVKGKKNVYTLQNEWADSEYDHFLHLTDQPGSTYKFMECAGGKDTAGEFEFRTAAGNTTASDTVTYNILDNTNGKYISFCTSSCASGYWIDGDYSSQADAMSLQLLEHGVTPGSDWGYCTSKHGVPEQVNVQIAGPDSVVINFVTFESTPPSDLPVIKMGSSAGSLSQTITGVTHTHTTAAKDRIYYMHFVRLSGLKPRTKYYYTVESGASDAVVSTVYNFRSPYGPEDGGETKVNVFGDMGVYTWNNMGNMYTDCVEKEDADLVIMMGDHAYNQGDDDERRGDGYMSAFSKTINHVPWMPIGT
jgi:hypothetical protein